MKKAFLQRAQRSLIGGLMMVMSLTTVTTARSQTNNYEFNDSHFHLTNNIQEGPNVGCLLGDSASEESGQTTGQS